MAQKCEIEWWILNTCLIPIVILHLHKLPHVMAAFLKKLVFTFYFVQHFLQKSSVVFYISWMKISDSDYELPCFKLTFDFYDIGKTSSGNNNSESTNEFQSSTKSNNNNKFSNKSLKKILVSIVLLEENDIEEFAKRQKALNTERGINTAVCQLMTWHIQRYGKPLLKHLSQLQS